MPEYRYLTAAQTGSYVWKSASASSAASLERELLSAEVLVLDLEAADGAPQAIRGRGKDAEKLLFLEQLETAFFSGMPLTRALDIALVSMPKGKFKTALESTRGEVFNGVSFSHAISRWPEIFDGTERALIGAGEEAGIMAESLQQINVSLRRSMEMSQRIGSLLLYPKIVGVVLVLVLVVLLGFTLPRFEGIFASSNVPLPWITQQLLGLSRWVGQHPVVSSCGLAVCSWFVWAVPFLIRGTAGIHKRLFLIPVLGAVFKKNLSCSFCRTFSQLLAANIPMLQALQYCREISWNIFYRECIAEACLRINAGRPFANALAPLGLILGEDVVGMLNFGEKSGAISKILTPLTQRMDHDLNLLVDRLKPTLEAGVTVGISLVVGTIILAAVLPVFDMVRVFAP
ncbi:MAG: component PulF [Verrucomicrobia bacterium]|nr:MAG: component PulF [Verrucomicrobiota bacterium]